MAILVSRSEAELDRMHLLATVRAQLLGLELFETLELVDEPGWQELGKREVAAIAFSSARAVRPFLRQAVQRELSLEDCLVAAVGTATGKALVQAGLTPGLEGEAGGELLAKTLAERLEAGSLVVYPGGRPRRPELEAGLEQRGHRVVEIDVYERSSVDPPPKLPTVPIEAVVLSSPRALGRYLELDGAPLGADHWVLGKTSAAAAAELGLQVSCASSPRLRDLLEELCTI